MCISRGTFNTISYAYSALLILIFLINQTGPENYILTFANLYSPQIYWAAPVAVLLIAALFVDKPRLPAIIHCSLMLIFVATTLMGFQFTGRLLNIKTSQNTNSIRFMTYNINGGKNAEALKRIILDENPGVILFQESSPDFLLDFQTSFPAWNIRANDDLMIASVYEISDFERVDLPKLSNDKWKRPAYLRAVVNDGTSRFAVYNTHLSTPREALNAMRHLEAGFYEQIKLNIRDREDQSNCLAAAVSKEKLPFILGGDFNAPEKSIMLYPLFKIGLKNTFSERGFGFGYTKGHDIQLGISFARIDHIFISDGWRSISSQAGSSLGSDHRPMLADVSLIE
jgi:endonuclease/exonuclease/phosphatase family metal-dependent hydrolase